MPAPRSRIPRSAAAQSSSTTANENVPLAPVQRARAPSKARDAVRVSAIPLAPAAAKRAATGRALVKSASTATLVIRQEAAPAPVAAIAVQHPSSDIPSPGAESLNAPELVRSTSKTAFDDERDDDDHQFQMPTPPNSQSPTEEAVLTEHRAQPSSSLLAPPAPQRTSRSRSLSTQPSTSHAPTGTRRASHSPALPPGPAHAPQVLAARRRSTVSPLPPAAPAPTILAAPAVPKSTATGRRKGKKLRARPSETLLAPLELGSSDDGDDPLLLLGPEQTRGRGEGKRRREVRWSAVPLAAGVQVGRRRSVKPEEASLEMDCTDETLPAREDAESATPAEWQRDGDDPAQAYQPLAFGAPVAGAADETDLGGFDGHDYYDPPAQQSLIAHDDSPLSDPGNGTADGGIGLGLGDLSPYVRATASAEREDEGVEGAFAPLREASSDIGSSDHEDAHDDAAGSSSASDSDEDFPAPATLPTMRRTRPSYPPLSPNRTGEWDAVVPVALDSSPPRALREPTPRPPRASFPPLSPNTTGEWDAVIDVRLESSPARGGGGRAGTATESEEEEMNVEAGRGRRASDWRVKIEEEHEEVVVVVEVTAEDAAIEQPLRTAPSAQQSTPAPSTSRVHISTPSNLLYSAIRSPSPAFTPLALVPPPSSARASRSPQPQLSFASPRVARSRLTNLASSPGPSPAPVPTPSSPKAWTRGPAFFRSSSFSPPAHADLPRTATLFARRPGRGRAGEEEEEESREYYRPGDATATSPDPEEVAGHEEVNEAEHEEDEEEDGDDDEEEIVLVGQEAAALERARTQSRSLSPGGSPSPAAEDGPAPPPTPAKDARAQPADDERMASPVSSASEGRASPARSASGDVLMSSPSPRNSPAGAKGLPLTPGQRDEDARMGSPSPMRTTGSPLKARIEGFVEEGRTKLQGLLFGPRAASARAEPVEECEEREEREEQPAPHDANVEEEEDDDEPFPQPKPHPRAPASHADSTFTSSRSHASFASSTSHRPRRRSRPSRPAGLPVIEISSTDARAAARAAAILKVHHKYIEQGVAAVDAAKIAQAEVAAADEQHAADDSEEEELRTLLLDAEDELRDGAPRAHSASTSDAASATPSAAGEPWTSREWRRLEQTLVQLGRRHRRGTSVSSAGVSMSMTSEAVALASVTGEEVDGEEVVEAFLRKSGVAKEDCSGDWAWDKLLVRVDALKARRAKDARQRRASSASTGFSHAQSRATRAPLTPPQERAEEAQTQTLEEEIRRASSPASAREDDSEEQETTPAADLVVKQEPLSDEEASPQRDSESEYSDEDGQLADDTFFASSTRSHRPRRDSIEPVYVPTALANPALRHLYDDFPLEKPKLPLKDYLRDDSPSSASGSGDEVDESGVTASAPRESTPDAASGNAELSKSPSSAQRLFSYIGSFVRRSPAPAPSPSSSTHALDGSSSTSPQPEMAQVQLSASLITPQFASTAKPFPPLPAHATQKPLPLVSDREIRPLPQHRTDASTSRVTLDGDYSGDCSAETSGDLSGASASSASLSMRRRRRSSGEGTGGRVWAAVEAIEELESSREEEESRIVELLQAGGTKRRAAGGDLRSALSVDGGKGKGKARETEWGRGFVEIDGGRTMIPTGTRALDRRVSGEKRASRR
ncbi:hypothetical protein JCM10450v2_004551 [Rhodotorula kratochvilovae]